MKMEYRQFMLATAVSALFSTQVWAAEDAAPSLKAEGSQSETVVVEEASPAPMPATKTQQSAPQTTFATPEVLMMYNKSPQELVDREVIGVDGEVLGAIDEVVGGRVSGRVYAVISRGGFLGIGASKYAVELDELRMADDQLQMAITGAELEMRREYVADRYVPVVPMDHPVSEFSAFEAAPQ
ncbi:PRC-barrel domain-containing protein [Marinobacterium sp. D7]|uniref:PRC-barrel domain-containing protein n=1 Tax=Marinobacterium ramblicola TaxID=2849041 RepID=UPI001C2D8007|nr:PRC-barrel domain-containing protein [Marinobacterium ramblicola]MBV1788314.1 PRC-barrel domain-containing protein [Marinobacterium ramblicola]